MKALYTQLPYRKSKRTKNKTPGFFLVEVSVTLLIVGIMLYVFSSTFSNSLKGIKRIRQFNSASTFMKNRMFDIISEFRQAPDTSPQSGFEDIDGYTYKWEVTFQPVEETEEKIFILHLKIMHEGQNVSEISTVIKKD